MTTVYVSATHADLAECREAIRTASRRLGIEDISMESYVAGSQQALEKCLSDVSRCDFYIGLFAWRYGFVPPGEDRSITELEYRKATQLGKPCLIFILADDARWPMNQIDRGAELERVVALRKELTDTHLCSFFRGPDDLAASATAALANLIRNASPLPQSAGSGPVAVRSVPTPEIWQRYYTRLRQCYQGVELDALTPPPQAKTLSIPLAVVFVEPDAREDARPETPRTDEHLDPRTADPARPSGATDSVDPADFAQLRASYHANPPSRLFDLLTDPDHRTIVLLGDPGAGKSAVARYLALCLIRVHQEARLAALDGFAPLLIELRSYAGLRLQDSRCENFLDYLDHRSRADGMGIAKGDLHSYLEGRGRALVVFDGLDEIFDRRQREEVANQIAAFAATYPEVRVLVTARIVGYSRRILSDAGFDHFTLEDLNESQIAEFLRRWYDRVMRESPDEAKILRRRMMGAIRDSPAIRELAGNPLLLSILAIIGKKQELPKERWQLYDHAANVLVDHWDAERHMRESHGGSDLIDTFDKKKLLRRLAYRMQSEHQGLNANYIDQDQLSQLFEDYLVERYAHPRGTAHLLANRMIEQFHQRNFILGRYGQHVYGFVHRTFLEFFYAQAVVRKFSERDPEWSMERLKELFAEHWADPSWHEILRLLAGAVDVSVAGELIGLLATEVNRPWPPEKFVEPPWNLALAVQCLAELRDPGGASVAAESLLRQLILLIEHGISIDDRNTAELIEAEILPAIRVIGTGWPGRRIYLDWYRRRGIAVSWTTGSSFATRVAILLATPPERVEDLLDTTLGGVDDRRARFALVAGLAESAALQVERHARVQQARRASCRELLEGHARTDNHGAVRLAAMQALVDHFPVDIPLTELLSERARADKHSQVRLFAVTMLGRRRNIDDPTRALLIDLARSDADGPVRRAAVEALATHCLSYDEVHHLLMDRVHRDVSAEVFSAAGRALVDQGGSNARLRSVLSRKIRPDSDDAIRHAAALLLGEFFSDYETRESLLGLARDDGDPGTRKAALHGLIQLIKDAVELRSLLVERIGLDDDASLRLTAQRTLVQRYPDDPAVGALLATQAGDDRDPTVRRAAVLELAAHFADDETVAILARLAIKDPAAGVRLAAAEALVEHFGTDPATRETVMKQAEDEIERDAIVRLAAVRILASLAGDTRLYDHLLDRVRIDPEPLVVRAAAAALFDSQTYQPMVLALLPVRASRDSYAGIRQAALDLLVDRSSPDPGLAALVLDRAWNDSDPAVIRTAANALVEHFGGGEELLRALLARADSDYWQIRLLAIELLGRHFGGEPHVRERLVAGARHDPDIQVRRAAVGVLGGDLSTHPDVRALLLDLIGDTDWSLRCAALHALGTHSAADEELRALFMDLAHHEPDPEFRRFVGQTLTWQPQADPDQLPDITVTPAA